MSGGSVTTDIRLLSKKETLERVHACAGGGVGMGKEGSGVWEPVGVSCWAGDKRPRGSHRMLD